jgi:hypothetical protein
VLIECLDDPAIGRSGAALRRVVLEPWRLFCLRDAILLAGAMETPSLLPIALSRAHRSIPHGGELVDQMRAEASIVLKALFASNDGHEALSLPAMDRELVATHWWSGFFPGFYWLSLATSPTPLEGIFLSPGQCHDVDAAFSFAYPKWGEHGFSEASFCFPAFHAIRAVFSHAHLCSHFVRIAHIDSDGG